MQHQEAIPQPLSHHTCMNTKIAERFELIFPGIDVPAAQVKFLDMVNKLVKNYITLHGCDV